MYRKTYISTNTSRSETISVSSLNIEEGFFDFGHSYFKFSSPSRNTPVSVIQVDTSATTSSASAQQQSGLYFDSSYSGIIIEIGARWSIEKKVVTIEYTKTTD